jgi:hypothetical protein
MIDSFRLFIETTRRGEQLMCPGAKPFVNEVALPFCRCGQVRIRFVLIEKNTMNQTLSRPRLTQ